MANLDNLRPIDLSHEEATKNGSKGGKASAKKRKQMKTFKELCNSFLDSKITKEEVIEKMKSYGIADDDVSYKMAMVVAMTNQAVKGNVKAFEVLRDTIGEKPKESLGVEFNQQSSKVLSSINKQLNKSLGGNGER